MSYRQRRARVRRDPQQGFEEAWSDAESASGFSAYDRMDAQSAVEVLQFEADENDYKPELNQTHDFQQAAYVEVADELAEEPKTPRTEKAKTKLLDTIPERLKNPTDLQIRIRTGAVYIGVTILCVLLGRFPTALYLAVVAAICAGEFYYMMRADAKLPNEMIGVIAAAAYPIAVWWKGMMGGFIVTILLIVSLLIWFIYYRRARIPDLTVSLFGAMYTGMLLSSIVIMRDSLPEYWGGILVLGIFVSIWANDSFAYLIGTKFGKHKLAPRVSPKKSWEGLIAGLAASAIIFVLIAQIPGVNMSWWMAIIFGVIVGVAVILGDLAESRIKRTVGVKDSGTLMPGHGGLLDRCDSLFLAAVVAAILLIWSGALPSALF